MELEYEMLPFATAYGNVNQDGSITFLTLRGEVTFGEKVSEIQKLLALCNGHRPLEEVKDESGLTPEDSELILEALQSHRIVMDSRLLGQSFQENSMYPLLSSFDLSPEKVSALTQRAQSSKQDLQSALLPESDMSSIVALASKRGSTRSWASGGLKLHRISGLLQAMYGVCGNTRPVPSAGGLYPLRIHLLFLQGDESFETGSYTYDPKSHSLSKLNMPVSSEFANFLLDSEGIANNATAVICISADMEAVTAKYANRAHRLVFLEAGHVAQNAYLYAAESGFGIVECGGFNDIELSKFLGLKFPEQPILTTLIVGAKAAETSSKFEEHYAGSEWHMRKGMLHGSEKLLRSMSFTTHHYRGYVMPRYVAHTKYTSADPSIPTKYEKLNVGTGMGVCLQEASVKAMGEAYERRSSGNVRVDIECTTEKASYDIYDLCEAAPQHSDYLMQSKLAMRTRESLVSWVKGQRLKDGSTVIAPIDQVFYPIPRKSGQEPLSYFATSTGIAGHPDKSVAIESALFELLERDAIAVTWYGRRTPTLIPPASWDGELRVRVKELKKQAKRDVVFCNLTLDSVPIVMCVITGPTYPHLTTGSAAHWNYANAMSKALDEAELMFHTIRCYPPRKRIIRPEEVETVTDHATLWSSKPSINELSWLINGKEEEPRNRECAWVELLDRFDPAVVDLSNNDGLGISVVRVLSKKLMPITFGFGAEHYGHPRVKMLGYKWNWQYPATPHCLA